MKKKNGFTLIELLAVIVILAIIALIATPIVLGLISRARKGAATDAAYGVRKEAQLVYSTALMEHPTAFNKIVVDFSKEVTVNGKKYPETKYYESANTTDATAKTDTVLFELDGTKPSSGTITINGNGTITYSGIKINGYDCTIPESGEISCGGNGSNNSGTTPGGNEQGGNEQGGTTPGGTTPSGTTSMIESCPGCKFIFPTESLAIEGCVYDDGEYSSDIPANATNDYTTLTGDGGHPYFIGVIESTTTPGKIGRAFACGIEKGKAFCIEGYDTSKYATNNITTLNNTFEGCNASASDSESYCNGENVYATSYEDGYVYVYDDVGCNINSTGDMSCFGD